MAERKIFAIGGGENRRLDSKRCLYTYKNSPMEQEIIRLSGKTNPNFLFLAHSQSSLDVQESYFNMMKNIYGAYFGCNCKTLLGDEIFDLNYVKDIVNWADIIYEGGGNTLDMIRLWKTVKFDLVLRKAWEDGKVMCGFSAGANCWFKECLSDSLQLKYGPHQPLISVECLGFIDGLFVPHCNELGRYESVREILLKKNS